MKWQNRLTKKELKHIRDFAGGTLRGFKQLRKGQKPFKLKKGFFICGDCTRIARKLKLEN